MTKCPVSWIICHVKFNGETKVSTRGVFGSKLAGKTQVAINPPFFSLFPDVIRNTSWSVREKMVFAISGSLLVDVTTVKLSFG